MPREFNLKYEFDPDGIDEIISEKGDMFLALREVRWKPTADYKLDLRHYKSDESGDRTLKGCSFTDDEGDELVRILMEGGLGDDGELADAITAYRPNLCEQLKSIFNENADPAKEDSRAKRLFTRVEKEEMEVEESGSLDDYFDARQLA